MTQEEILKLKPGDCIRLVNDKKPLYEVIKVASNGEMISAKKLCFSDDGTWILAEEILKMETK
jgi:hypothetical protein